MNVTNHSPRTRSVIVFICCTFAVLVANFVGIGIFDKENLCPIWTHDDLCLFIQCDKTYANNINWPMT